MGTLAGRDNAGYMQMPRRVSRILRDHWVLIVSHRAGRPATNRGTRNRPMRLPGILCRLVPACRKHRGTPHVLTNSWKS